MGKIACLRLRFPIITLMHRRCSDMSHFLSETIVNTGYRGIGSIYNVRSWVESPCGHGMPAPAEEAKCMARVRMRIATSNACIRRLKNLCDNKEAHMKRRTENAALSLHNTGHPVFLIGPK